MASDQRKINREALVDFIRGYANQPCLWRIKSKEYHDKAIRDVAYNKLLETYRIIDPNANRDAVIRKINALRTNYRKEKKKVDESLRPTYRTKEIYKPTLWYYHLFQFLEDQESPKTPALNWNETEESARQQYKNQSMLKTSLSKEMEVDIKQESCRPPKQRDRCDSVLGKIEQHLKKNKTTADRYDVFGKNVAFKMRDISENTQKLIAEKLINEALFMAEMGHLTMAHSVCVPIDNASVPQFYSALYEPTLPKIEPNNSDSESSDNSRQSFVSNLNDV